MAVLTDLPPEILDQIYRYLGSIDDVHHFGRTCTKMHHVIKRRQLYLEIMRTIIHSSPQHRYDYQLCKAIEVHRKIVAHLKQDNRPFSASLPGSSNFNIWESLLTDIGHTCTCSSAWTDDEVCDVLARYQGLRVLQNMWLERDLKDRDFLSVDDTTDAQHLTDRFFTLVNRDEQFRDGYRAPRTRETCEYEKFNADQRGRFYAAVVSVWLLNEIRWVLTNFASPANFTLQVGILEQLKKRIAAETETSVVDELDRYAVFSFMYLHLLPLYASFLADANSSKLPFTFSLDFTKDRPHSTRLLQLFLMAGQTYFQPPELIDLALRSRISRKFPYPLLPIPCSTEKWRRPLPNLFPRNRDICVEDLMATFQRTSITHLTLINRSSFHQTRYNMSQGGISPSTLGEALFKIPDHARAYFADRCMVAFELGEVKRSEAQREIRVVFPKNWKDIRWAVWWWAASEDKARMKMERLREAE